MQRNVSRLGHGRAPIARESSRQDNMERVRLALPFIPSDDHEVWLKVGMAIQSEFGEEGWQIFDDWSSKAKNYDAKENRSRWQSFAPGGGITIATLFGTARNNGWRDLSPPKSTKPIPPDARSKAEALCARAVDASPEHPYLKRKALGNAMGLKAISAASAAEILGYAPKGRGQLRGSLLVVPISRAGKMTSAQLIDGDGNKHFLAKGAISGGYWCTRELRSQAEARRRIFIAEGVATAMTAASATNDVAVAALSNSNLRTVANDLKAKYPEAVIHIVADVDKATGTPDRHAVQAAEEVGGILIEPPFEPGRIKDLNDLLVESDLEAVKAAIANGRAAVSWAEPKPIERQFCGQDYPLEALPDLLREAVAEVHGYTQAPVSLIANCALSALSLVCQPLYDARRDHRLIGPTSVYFLTVAESGERKSTIDAFFMAPVRDWQNAKGEEMASDVVSYQAALAAWEDERDGIRAAIRKKSEQGQPPADLLSRLDDLQLRKPKAPRIPALLLSDETPESLAFRLHSQWPAAGLISSEAGVVFGGHGMSTDTVMRYLGFLNVLWDGGELPIGRKTSESFTVRGARLTMGLQLQEATLQDFLARNGKLARGMGFFARFLISWPNTTQGTRFYKPPGPMPALEAYQHRIRSLLAIEAPLQPDGTLLPKPVAFSPDAQSAWTSFHDEIEGELSDAGSLREVRDVAAKAAENAARLAVLFECLADSKNPSELLAVSHDSLTRAATVVRWHLSEARRFFGSLALPEDLGDAAKLSHWIADYCRRERRSEVAKNYVRQHGPSLLRSKKRLDAALEVLVEHGHVRVTTSEKTMMIEVNPARLA